MSKDYWIHAYECAIEDLCEELDIGWDEAEEILQGYLEKDPKYLDGYISYEE